jgi:hypothetical protein
MSELERNAILMLKMGTREEATSRAKGRTQATLAGDLQDEGGAQHGSEEQGGVRAVNT